MRQNFNNNSITLKDKVGKFVYPDSFNGIQLHTDCLFYQLLCIVSFY